jgi:hypothetical protein
VHEGEEADAFLHDVVEVTQPRELRLFPRTAYEDGGLDAGTFDLIVFDRISGHALPGVPSLTVGGVPAGIETQPAIQGGGRRVLSWARQHALMRYVSLDSLVYAGFGGMELPRGAETLATGPDGPVMALLGSRSVRHVIVGFSLAQSNWPTHVSLTVFIQNVLDTLLPAATGQVGRGVQPGQSTDVRAAGGAMELVVRGPVTRTVAIRGGDERVTIPGLPRAGLYSIEGAVESDRDLAVSVVSDVETDIRLRDSVPVASKSMKGTTGEGSGGRDIWPWLVMAALGIAVIEWIAWLWRLRI